MGVNAQNRYETNVSLSLAEHVPPMIVQAEMQQYETRRNPEGLFRSAWNYAEYGLNQTVEADQASRRYHFEYAQGLIGMALKHPDVHQDVVLGGLVLSSYIPLFHKRSEGLAVDTDDCRMIYRSLGEAMRFLQPLEVNQPPQWRMAETAVLALSARTSRPDLLLYPSSPREEASANAPFNHDSYFIENDTKIPIQQKLIETDKQYHELITVLTLKPLVERSMKKSRQQSQLDMANQINYLLALIVTETNGCRLTRNEEAFMNSMTQAIASHRWARNRIIRKENAA